MLARRWIGLAALLIASSAAAQDSEGPASHAEKLFREGVAAAEQNDYVTACAKFEQSLDLVERASTLLNLGTCEAEQGKLATAYRYYKKGIGMLQPGDERLAATTKLIDELSARVPRLRIELSEATPASARVVIDDADVPPAELESVMLDPGKHRVVLRTPDHEDATATVELAEKDQKTIELAPGPATKKTTDGPLPGPKPDPAADDEAPELAIPGYIIGAIGVGAAVAAAVTGGLIIANDGTIEERCPNLRCDAEGADLVETNKTLLIVNAVTFGVAAAGIATGAALLIADAVLGGREESATVIRPVVSPTGVFVGVATRF